MKIKNIVWEQPTFNGENEGECESFEMLSEILPEEVTIQDKKLSKLQAKVWLQDYYGCKVKKFDVEC